jgi:hypothetical protein
MEGWAGARARGVHARPAAGANPISNENAQAGRAASLRARPKHGKLTWVTEQEGGGDDDDNNDTTLQTTFWGDFLIFVCRFFFFSLLFFCPLIIMQKACI